MNNTIHTSINFKGLKEQSFKFAFGWKGGMKQCFTCGAEINVPAVYSLRGKDLSEAMKRYLVYQGEVSAKHYFEKYF